MNDTELLSAVEIPNLPPVPSVPPPEVVPPTAELLQALVEERFLERTGDEQTALVWADFQVGYDLMEAPALEQYSGQFIAILKGQFVGHGPRSGALNEAIAETYHVHLRRPALLHLCNEMC